ncbi:hypothetical protein SAMN04489761_3213 [Tenacibaculum sp. MAR_2009_124]|uniref:hypothetical protein n=1 Tax=Tenacibaculum sp. MAR_2009_124 TaxID=1250059 RepID=UPI000899868B|nr:hypothetical protein [Tenacibaculum sp. MAR_2009_124]SEC51913.1 hypothetical protein SAMN04489761_3213 [Tenacibaculum sp. MAR_2009_124]
MEELKLHTFGKDDQINAEKNKHRLYGGEKKGNRKAKTFQEETQLKKLDKISREKKRNSRMNLY